jgi:hypothetical protein
MAADLSKYEYVCPICGDSFGSKRRVKQHVTDSVEDEHQGKNGFKMTKTIQRNKDKDEMTLEEKFVEAGRKFDNLGHDEAKQLADKAQENTDNRYISKKYVARVWIDAGYDLDGHLLHKGTAFSDLTTRQKTNLAVIYYEYGEDPSYDNMNLLGLARDIGLGRSDIRNTYRRYSFYLKNKYLPSEIENEEIEVDEYTHEDNSETSSENEQTQNDTGHRETEMNVTSSEDSSMEYSPKTSPVLNKAKALSDSGVDVALTLEIQEDNFQAIQKLIKNGYDDLAEELYNEE